MCVYVYIPRGRSKNVRKKIDFGVLGPRRVISCPLFPSTYRRNYDDGKRKKKKTTHTHTLLTKITRAHRFIIKSIQIISRTTISRERELSTIYKSNDIFFRFVRVCVIPGATTQITIQILFSLVAPKIASGPLRFGCQKPFAFKLGQHWLLLWFFFVMWRAATLLSVSVRFFSTHRTTKKIIVNFCPCSYFHGALQLSSQHTTFNLLDFSLIFKNVFCSNCLNSYSFF